MVKKFFSVLAAALMSASMFAAPATVPTVQDLTDAGYDLTGRVICLYFDEQVCNDIVWAGSYNEWSTTPVDMQTFEPLEGYQGWYVIELWDDSETVQGRPFQLKKDGSFSWDFQSGDADAWFNMDQPGTQTATIDAGLPGEANCTWPTTGAYIYEVEYFKNHNTPCGEDKPKHDYTITAYLPQFCDAIAAYADSVRVMGGFDNWTNGIWMEKKIDEDFNDYWYAEIYDVEEGTEFNLRFGTDAGWAVQVQLDGEDLDNMMTGETTDIILQFDGEGYGFAACAPAPAVGDQFVDATSGLKFEVTSLDPKAVKVIANNYTGISYNVPDTVVYLNEKFAVKEIGDEAFYGCTALQSVTFLGNACQNAIGEDAFSGVGATDPALLTLPDNWTGTIPDEDGNWYGGKFEMSSIPTGLIKVDNAQCTMHDGKFMHNGQLIIRKGDKHFDALGAEVK